METWAMILIFLIVMITLGLVIYNTIQIGNLPIITVTNAPIVTVTNVPEISITGGMGIGVENTNGNYVIDNIVTMRKFRAGENITAGSNVSVLNDLLYMGFSDPESTLIQNPTVNLIKTTMMSDNNVITGIAASNDDGIQIGFLTAYTYISGENDGIVCQIGTSVNLPTTGLTAPNRIANAFSIVKLDPSRFAVIYSDTSGTATTAVINRLIVGTFTPGSEFVTPSITLPTSQSYGTINITVTKLGSQVTSATPIFTSNMVNMFLRYTSGTS